MLRRRLNETHPDHFPPAQKKKKKTSESSSSDAGTSQQDGAKPKVDKGEADRRCAAGRGATQRCSAWLAAHRTPACHRRYNAALEVARKGEDLWIDLSSCSVHLAKAKKVRARSEHLHASRVQDPQRVIRPCRR